MKILQIAPLWESVPPATYGGTEAVVHLLVEELVKLGHDVTLVASGDSMTSARLKSCYPRSLRTAPIQDKVPYSLMHSAVALREAEAYDIVHNHAGEEILAMSALLRDVPMLTTMHCMITPDTKYIWDHYGGFYNTISWSQARNMQKMAGGRFAGVVYNGIDVASFPFQGEKSDHLLFLGRISMDKGTHLAIEVAKRTGRRLLIAGKVDPADYNYFLSMVAPHLDGERIVYAGEADAGLKRELYREASCVLMPILWEEPFGLVMAESQACGTPVIVFNRGAAPEIVRDGETGFVVDTVEEMTQAVARVGEIDASACRANVEHRFDAKAMADCYIETYGQILEAATPASAACGDESGRTVRLGGRASRLLESHAGVRGLDPRPLTRP